MNKGCPCLAQRFCVEPLLDVFGNDREESLDVDDAVVEIERDHVDRRCPDAEFNLVFIFFGKFYRKGGHFAVRQDEGCFMTARKGFDADGNEFSFRYS